MGKVTLEIGEALGAEKESRNKEKCRHAERTQVPHSEVRVRKILFNVEQANEQKDESLEFVNPADSRLPVIAHDLVPSLFVADCGAWSVAGEYDCFCREREEF